MTEQTVAGDIAALGLKDWWAGSFASEDREWMARAYAPAGPGNRVLVEGVGLATRQRAFWYLCNVATWFNKDGHQHCAIAFIDKAIEFYSDEIDVLDRHFAFASQCDVIYRWRDTQAGALERAVRICEMSVAINKEAAARFLKELGEIPSHACFRQLRIIEEKRGNYQRAIELCEMAKEGGWAGSWDKDIARLMKKQNKLGA